MLISRRGLVKTSAAALAAGTMLDLIAPDKAHADALKAELKRNYERLVGARETTTVCPYCASGCSTLAHTIDGELVNMEGDPDHPSTQGALCPKGAAQLNTRNVIDPETGELISNPARARHALYRAPGSTSFTKVDLHWALKEIAVRTYNSREKGFQHTDENGVVVNRNENIAWIGFASADNEEAALITKLVRGLGITFFDHQARI